MTRFQYLDRACLLVAATLLASLAGCARAGTENGGPDDASGDAAARFVVDDPALDGAAANAGGRDAPARPVPWTDRPFDDRADDFTFAIIGDLTAGERPDIFRIALEQLSLLRPGLIMSVGDLIEGESRDREILTAEWEAFDERAMMASAPLFRVSGNHDATARELRDLWLERYGRLHYHFVYRDVLFLVLDTEDYTPGFRARMAHVRDSALEVLRTEGRDAYLKTEYFRTPERQTGGIGPEQSEYVVRAIAEHPDVRWTMLFMHKPIWRADDPEFAAIEDALAERPYTVFAGHFHALIHEERNGRDYIQLGTTGGRQDPSIPIAFDHVTLVTMTDDGPSIAHLRLDGILDRTGQIPAGGDTLCFQAERCGGG